MLIEVSIGEIYDKISILSIKLEKVKNEEAKFNILKEYTMLVDSVKHAHEKEELYEQLLVVNKNLWAYEDKIREFEKLNLFNEEFIIIARSIYKENDKRAQIKKTINLKYKSDLIEEKLY
jgi:hypothetical protein